VAPAPILLRGRALQASQWLSLFVTVRLLGVLVATGLLLGHRATPGNRLLAVLILGYGTFSAAGAAIVPAMRARWVLWSADAGVMLAFLIAGQACSSFGVLGSAGA